MSVKQDIVRSGRMVTEGDELYYEVRGQGQPLLMIPAARWSFSPDITVRIWICRLNGLPRCSAFCTRLKE